MACRLFGAKPLSKPMLGFCKLDLKNKLQWNINQNTKLFIHLNSCQNGICKMAAILSMGRWVKGIHLLWYRQDSCYWVNGLDWVSIVAASGLGAVSVSDNTSSHKISLSFKVARLVVLISSSLSNLTCTSAALLPSACRISEGSCKSKYRSHGFETLRDLTIRCLIRYWNRALVP